MDDRSNLALMMFIRSRPTYFSWKKKKEKEKNQIHVGIWKLSKVSIKFTRQD